jgi:hypothetical protein
MSLQFGKMFFNTIPKISLNDRFQMLRQNAQRRAQNQTNVKNKSNAILLRQGSQRNRRLALQMANRPAVIAALNTNSNANSNQNSVNVKQRLGVQRNQLNAKFGSRVLNNRNRTPKRFLNRNNNGLGINRNNGSGINRNNSLGINRNRVMNRNKINKFINRPNNAQNIGVIVGMRQPMRKAGIRKNRFGRSQSMRLAANSVKVGAKQRKRVNKVQQQIQTQSNKFTARKFRINRNFKANNNSLAQRNRKNTKQMPNKQQLDNELDAYMARTKSHLDAEIDEYMSQAS